MNGYPELNSSSPRVRSVGILVITVGLCFITVAEGAPPIGTPSCSNLEYYDEVDNRCHPCLKCNPGFGLSEICGDEGKGKNAECQPCLPEFYSPVFSSDECAPCRLCSNTMEDKILCTTRTDRQCGVCELGYFRYDPSDDHCQSCDDERSNHLYPDCLRTNPPASFFTLPSSTEDFLTRPIRISKPQDDPTLGTVAIVLIVVMVVAVVIFCVVAVVLIYKYCPPTCVCKRGSHQRLSQNIGESPLGNGVVSLSRGDSETTSKEETPLEMSHLLGTVSDANPQGDRVQESLQGAEPISDDHHSSQHQPGVEDVISDPLALSTTPENEVDNEGAHNQGCSSLSEGPNGQKTDSDTEQKGWERRGSDKSSSESRGTQTSSTEDVSTPPDNYTGDQTNKESDDDQRKQFLERLQHAIEFTLATSLGDIHADDANLLHRKLYEQPEVAETSAKFNYLNLAKLFSIDLDDMKTFKTAKDVVFHIADTDKSHPTVAQFLKKMADSNQCNIVVGKLVDQILLRASSQSS